jgi:RNA polymerase sigma-70 factor (ECF subfamily)
MTEDDGLARRFDESRDHLRAVALRMLGSPSEADDAVQDAWLKVSGADTREVKNLGGWLTTVVARVCLDMLRTRKSRREESLASASDAPSVAAGSAPETELAIADAIGPALLVVLDMLAPAERVAFVLHDMFDLPFDEIAPILDRSPDAARQLASRARRRVRGAATPPAERARRHALVEAFLAASRDGDFERLVAVLSPEVVLHADEIAVRAAAARREQGAPALSREVRGASLVAGAFKGRATGALRATIDGEPGAVWAMGGTVRAAFVFTVDGDKIAAIDLVMDPQRLGELDVQLA